jgi:uncharacterized protein
MSTWIDATALRIMVSEDDTHGDRPLYQAILFAARDAKLAGAYSTRGLSGYGRSGHIHEVWRGFSYDLPVIIEIVDSDEKIDAWLPTLDRLGGSTHVTRHRVQLRQSDETAR